MKFTDKDLLKVMGLEVGDFVLVEGKQWEVAKTVKGLKIWSDDYMKYEDLSDLIGIEFEKVEQKIWTKEWTKETYELGEDKAYYVDNTGSVTWIRIHGDIEVLDNYIYFTKRKYAEEYLEELKKFNEEYKKNN